MSTDVATRKLELDLADFRQVVKYPLRMLQGDVKVAALRFWACHRHLANFETPLPLAAALTVWIEEFGLRDDDAADICREMLNPALMGDFKFASDLMTALAQRVANKIAQRKREDETRKKREEEAEAKANAASGPEIRSMLSKLFTGTPED